MVQFAHLYNVILMDVDVDLRATFDSGDKFDIGGPGAAFQKVIYRVTVDSPSPEEQVQQLLAHAERGCHSAQSLRLPVEVLVEAVIKNKSIG
jgi:organic hydroperoxide reductase OsmC/OhrA